MDYTIVIPRRGINDDNKGKKHALHRLISSAGTEWIWTMDDDIERPPHVRDQYTECAIRDEHMQEPQCDLLILLLKMDGGKTLIERLQRAEYAALQEITFVSARLGHPLMCSGANLMVRRQLWLDYYDELHPELPSGDDMFLLESMKRHHKRISVSNDKELTATVHPQPTLRALMHQRMRWAGKAPHYRDKEIRLIGTLVVLTLVLQVIFPPIILLKFPIDYHIIKKRDASVSLGTALLLEVVYPFYAFISLIGGLFRHQW